MIIENVFYAEIQLKNGDLDEFAEQGWYALKVNEEYPEEEIGNNAFLDWARDLTWIEEKHIVVVVKGSMKEETHEIIEFLNRHWANNFQNSKKEEYKKQVDFIVVG